jgi:integrase
MRFVQERLRHRRDSAGKVNMTAALRIGGESAKAIPKYLNFGTEALARIACPPGKDRIYVYDSRVHGLCQVITAKGARAFYVLRKVAGRTERIRLGGPEITVAQARQLASRVNGEIAKGNNPQAAKRILRDSETVGELFTRWAADLKADGASERTLVTDKSRFETCCESVKDRKTLSITENDVRALHQRIGKSIGHVSANRGVQLLRRMFNWARIPNPIQRGTVDFFAERSRERFLTGAEIARLFKALSDINVNPLIADFVRVALFTGQRRSNVSAMHVSDLDLDNCIWTIPANQSKNGSAIRVHLSEPAVKVIRARLGHPSGYIFPGHGESGHFIEPKAAWSRIRDLANLPDVTIHDLRRTMASIQAASGTSLTIIGKSLGHKSTRATSIYARLDLAAVKESVDAAAATLEAMEGAR